MGFVNLPSARHGTYSILYVFHKYLNLNTVKLWGDRVLTDRQTDRETAFVLVMMNALDLLTKNLKRQVNDTIIGRGSEKKYKCKKQLKGTIMKTSE